MGWWKEDLSLRHSTGKVIGASCGNSMANTCGSYEEGFKVSFNFVWGILKGQRWHTYSMVI